MEPQIINEIPNTPPVEPVAPPLPSKPARKIWLWFAAVAVILLSGVGYGIFASQKINRVEPESSEPLPTPILMENSPSPVPPMEIQDPEVSRSDIGSQIFTSKMQDNEWETNFDIKGPQLNIPDIKLTSSIPSGCISWKHTDKNLAPGNADYFITCKKNNAQSVLEISVNPTITGGGFGGLDPNATGDENEAPDPDKQIIATNYQKQITLYGKKLSWIPWTSKRYMGKSGFYLSRTLTADPNAWPAIKYNGKEVLLNAYLVDVNSNESISNDGKLVLDKLNQMFESLKTD